jgi:hypothetical protein
MAKAGLSCGDLDNPPRDDLLHEIGPTCVAKLSNNQIEGLAHDGGHVRIKHGSFPWQEFQDRGHVAISLSFEGG